MVLPTKQCDDSSTGHAQPRCRNSTHGMLRSRGSVKTASFISAATNVVPLKCHSCNSFCVLSVLSLWLYNISLSYISVIPTSSVALSIRNVYLVFFSVYCIGPFRIRICTESSEAEFSILCNIQFKSITAQCNAINTYAMSSVCSKTNHSQEHELIALV